MIKLFLKDTKIKFKILNTKKFKKKKTQNLKNKVIYYNFRLLKRIRNKITYLKFVKLN